MSNAPPVASESTFAYLNRERTHEVLALAEIRGAVLHWTVTERPAGSAERGEWLIEESTAEPAGLGGLVRDLESRLAASGSYFRLSGDGGAPEPLGDPPEVDMRSHAVPIPGADEQYLEYFHFHGRGQSRVLMALPRAALGAKGADAGRFVLASFDFPTGVPRLGRLEVKHARLAPELVVGRVVGEHLALPRSGFRKLFTPDEYRSALGPDWKEKAQSALATATSTLFRAKAPAPAEAAAGVAVPEPEFIGALQAASYKEARERLLGPGGADRALAVGEPEIRRAVKAARRRAPHDDQPRLSLLEAGLLVEHGLRSGRQSLIREYAPQLVRMSRSVAPPARF